MIRSRHLDILRAGDARADGAALFDSESPIAEYGARPGGGHSDRRQDMSYINFKIHARRERGVAKG